LSLCAVPPPGDPKAGQRGSWKHWGAIPTLGVKVSTAGLPEFLTGGAWRTTDPPLGVVGTHDSVIVSKSFSNGFTLISSARGTRPRLDLCAGCASRVEPTCCAAAAPYTAAGVRPELGERVGPSNS
jgi:hypothetical protein